jgi:hypothetical protein
VFGLKEVSHGFGPINGRGFLACTTASALAEFRYGLTDDAASV